MDVPVLAMIERSGWMARGVLILLGVFSIVTWAVIFDRLMYYTRVSRNHRRVTRALGDSMVRLADVASTDKSVASSPMGVLAGAAATEHQRIMQDCAAHGNVSDWSFFLNSQFAMAREHLDAAIADGVGKLDRGTVVLAVMASAAPFIGLFGTCWGVMNSFFQIGNSGAASLPVVAPGIAEALITTIVGLSVAIPAVFFYNLFVHRVERTEDELGSTRDLLMVRIKRDVLGQFYGGGAR